MPRCSLAERGMGHTEGAGIAPQAGQASHQLSVRAACEQRRKQRIFLRASGIDVVDSPGGATVE